jgi:hypothetical protein
MPNSSIALTRKIAGRSYLPSMLMGGSDSLGGPPHLTLHIAPIALAFLNLRLGLAPPIRR